MSGVDNTSFTVRSSVAVSETITNNDFVLLCDPSAGAMTVNLPSVLVIQPGREYVIRTTGTTNTVTIDGFGSETIDGNTTKILASGAIHGVTIVSTGSQWFTITSF